MVARRKAPSAQPAFTARERPMTVDEFERLAPHIDGPSELVDGRLRLLSPTGFLHGDVALTLGFLIKQWVRSFPPGQRPGAVVGAETGFRVSDPRRPVMAPDVGFVRHERRPSREQRDRFYDGPPDFAAEVPSPGDSRREVREKEQAWLAVGARLVWTVDPVAGTVKVLRANGATATLGRGEVLSGEDVMPGLRIAVDDIFEDIGGDEPAAQ